MTTLSPPDAPQQLKAATPPAMPRSAVAARRTPLAAHGEPAIWLMGAALVGCTILILSLLSLVLVQGLSTFWPQPIDRVTLTDGRTFLGIAVREERYTPSQAEAGEIRRAIGQGQAPASVFDEDGLVRRRQYRVGNRELDQQPFVWVPLHTIASVDRPRDAVMLERREWGVWFGKAEAVLRREGDRTETLAEGDAAWAAFVAEHPIALARYAEIARLRGAEMGRVNALIEGERRRIRAAEIAHEREGVNPQTGLPLAAWLGVIVATAGFAAAAAAAVKRVRAPAGSGSRRLGARLTCAMVWPIVAAGLVVVWLERPRDAMTDARLAAIRADAAERDAQFQVEHDSVLAKIRELEAADARERVVFREITTNRFAPVRKTEPDEPMIMSQIVRAVPANDLSFAEKVGVYVDRWNEFLTDDPREANTEGGVMPVIFGTVLLTLLLAITVVPLGVIAALYLREYAKQGLVTSAVRIAVNNLAGVPSIVYGVFGLGFFCYTLGQYIDAGPESGTQWPRFPWWFMVAGVVVVVAGALGLVVIAKPRPGRHASTMQVWFKRVAGLLWVAAAGLVVALFATTPYFHGFHREGLPNPTFGTRGILWGALTLALLTLPVVIVATEEAVAAVPRSMREGSFGCGASRWQTIQRIVLPGAMPGIMTGMILAMARGAGEVAPLMLVGAVKLAPALPISGEWPFVHLERSFMHLGFHIYDLGFQSPDAEAARPLVWTTTLLLIAIVVLLNLVAITIRNRLRARLSSGQF